MGGGGSTPESAFKISDHINLVRTLGLNTEHPTIRWKTVEDKMEDRLRRPLGDLAGRNVLYYEEGQARRYVVIDQVKKGTYL